MARPTKLTDEVQETICEAITIGATYEIAANYAGIAYETFNNWMKAGREAWAKSESESDEKLTTNEKKYLKFLQAVEQANGAGAVTHLNFLYQIAPHDRNVSQWILERRYTGYDRPQRVEHSGPEGKPIQTQDVSEFSPEERVARMLALLEAAKQRRDDSPTE